VLQRALAKDPADRFPAVADCARAFASAGAAAADRSSIAPQLGAAVDSMIEQVRALAVPAGSIEHAWFALRAALLLEDPELLAAADLLVRDAPPGWAAHAVAVLVARARADQRSERAALEALLTAAASCRRRREGARALLAAVTVLDRRCVRSPEGGRLAAWAAERLAQWFSTPLKPGHPDTNRLATAALELARADAPTSRHDLETRLDDLLRQERGDVRLWALASDVFADERFVARALRARVPRRPVPRALALLRRYQITGDPRWLGLASGVLGSRAGAPPSAVATALLFVELKAPERAVFCPA
jgi:hypothetical protein